MKIWNNLQNHYLKDTDINKEKKTIISDSIWLLHMNENGNRKVHKSNDFSKKVKAENWVRRDFHWSRLICRKKKMLIGLVYIVGEQFWYQYIQNIYKNVGTSSGKSLFYLLRTEGKSSVCFQSEPTWLSRKKDCISPNSSHKIIKIQNIKTPFFPNYYRIKK